MAIADQFALPLEALRHPPKFQCRMGEKAPTSIVLSYLLDFILVAQQLPCSHQLGCLNALTTNTYMNGARYQQENRCADGAILGFVADLGTDNSRIGCQISRAFNT